MQAVGEIPPIPQPAPGPASSKLLRLLRRRVRQLLFGVAGLGVAAGIFAVWWLASLHGLPDVGDPFDVAAMRAFHLPDEANAFTYFRQAQAKLTPEPDLLRSAMAAPPVTPWSKLDPKLRAWVEANRAALELFEKGADQSDGIARPAGENYSAGRGFINPRRLWWLAFLEGRKREERGDMAGAWQCYRTVLRTTSHYRRRGSIIERFLANDIHDELRRRIAAWSADPRTTLAQLRGALDEVLASQPRPEWDTFSLKVEYLDMIRWFDQPIDVVRRGLVEDLTYRLGDMQLPTEYAVYVFAAQRFIAREPERSKRTLRLLFANWLAHVEAPAPGQRKPTVRATLSSSNHTSTLPLYPVSPGAPAAARVLSPQDAAKWLVTTRDLKLHLWNWLWPSVRHTEKTGYADLVLSLAEELYRREHGSPPPSEQALVGTYLDSLPDDGSDELDDGTTPTISGASVSTGTEKR